MKPSPQQISTEKSGADPEFIATLVEDFLEWHCATQRISPMRYLTLIQEQADDTMDTEFVYDDAFRELEFVLEDHTQMIVTDVQYTVESMAHDIIKTAAKTEPPAEPATPVFPVDTIPSALKDHMSALEQQGFHLPYHTFRQLALGYMISAILDRTKAPQKGSTPKVEHLKTELLEVFDGIKFEHNIDIAEDVTPLVEILSEKHF